MEEALLPFTGWDEYGTVRLSPSTTVSPDFPGYEPGWPATSAWRRRTCPTRASKEPSVSTGSAATLQAPTCSCDRLARASVDRLAGVGPTNLGEPAVIGLPGQAVIGLPDLTVITLPELQQRDGGPDAPV